MRDGWIKEMLNRSNKSERGRSGNVVVVIDGIISWRVRKDGRRVVRSLYFVTKEISSRNYTFQVVCRSRDAIIKLYHFEHRFVYFYEKKYKVWRVAKMTTMITE